MTSQLDLKIKKILDDYRHSPSSEGEVFDAVIEDVGAPISVPDTVTSLKISHWENASHLNQLSSLTNLTALEIQEFSDEDNPLHPGIIRLPGNLLDLSIDAPLNRFDCRDVTNLKCLRINDDGDIYTLGLIDSNSKLESLNLRTDGAASSLNLKHLSLLKKFSLTGTLGGGWTLPTSVQELDVRSPLCVNNFPEIFSRLTKLKTSSVLDPSLTTTRLLDLEIIRCSGWELITRFPCLRRLVFLGRFSPDLTNFPMEKLTNLTTLLYNRFHESDISDPLFDPNIFPNLERLGVPPDFKMRFTPAVRKLCCTILPENYDLLLNEFTPYPDHGNYGVSVPREGWMRISQVLLAQHQRNIGGPVSLLKLAAHFINRNRLIFPPSKELPVPSELKALLFES